MEINIAQRFEELKDAVRPTILSPSCLPTSEQRIEIAKIAVQLVLAEQLSRFMDMMEHHGFTIQRGKLR